MPRNLATTGATAKSQKLKGKRQKAKGKANIQN
jgi:hypothetical protein